MEPILGNFLVERFIGGFSDIGFCVRCLDWLKSLNWERSER